MAVVSYGPEVEKLEKDIDEQAKKVVQLKEQNAAAADVTAAVEQLVAL